MRAFLTSVAVLALAACAEAHTDQAKADEAKTDEAPATPQSASQEPVQQVEQSMDELLAVLNSDASDDERLAALDKTLAQVRSANEEQQKITAALQEIATETAPTEPKPVLGTEMTREELDAAIAELEKMFSGMPLLENLGAQDITPPPEDTIADQPVTNWMNETRLDPDVMDQAYGEPESDTPEFSVKDTAWEKLPGMRSADWPTDVLIGGVQDRLLKRDRALEAVNDKNVLEVQRLLLEMDKSGDPYRYHIRALASYEGIGMPKNEAAVLEYAKAAVEADVPEAAALMNGIYLIGIGVEPDLKKAKLWHLRMMEARLPDSYRRFGDAIANDVYGEIEPQFALHVLEHSENLFRDNLKAARAELLISGAGGRTDLAKAHELATDLASKDWDEDMQAQGRALLARPEFAAAGFSAEK